MQAHNAIPLQFETLAPEQMLRAASDFAQKMQRRRSVRMFSSEPVDRAVIDACILAAASAPSGANQQPWHFVIVESPAIKQRIRVAAEAEERAFYERRATTEWLDALSPLGTDAEKPFLELAPFLIAIFYEAYGVAEGGRRIKRYYPIDSVGIASGVLIAGLHLAGLATLTHTPSPMAFLSEILERPDNERPFLLLVVGYPAADATVPDIQRKTLAQVTTVK